MNLGMNKIETLRQQKLEQRDAADQKKDRKAETEYSLPMRVVWSVIQVGRHAWLNVYPLVGLAVGIVFIACIGQAREILANLEQTELFVGVLAVWAVSIWYTMRVLSGTDFPGDELAHPAAGRSAAWLNAESPRLAPFAGLAVIACTSSIFLPEAPSPAWFVVLAAGIVPLTWGVAWLGDRGVRFVRPLEQRPVYTIGVAASAIVAWLIAWAAWASVPQPIRSENVAWHLEDWLLFGCAALTLAPLLFGRRGAISHSLMATASALWLWVVSATFGHHGGSRLPLAILVLAALGLWLISRRRELFGIRQDASTPQVKVSSTTMAALGAALALQLVLVIAFTWAPIGLAVQLGTLCILFLGLSICAFFGIVWVFAPKYATLPSLALVPVIWALVFGHSPDHTLRDTRFDAAEGKARPRIAEHYAAWQAELPKRKDGEDKPAVFFVAAAGGGLRAAYWTAHMLAAADDATCGEFGRHVYAYSGVSGGSLGISAYLAQRQVWAAKSAAERCQPGRRAEMSRMLNRDFLAPVFGSIFFAEMAQRFLPVTYLDEDRGTTLARSWSRAWDDVFPQAKGRFDQPFLAQFRADKTTPAVFLNSTGVQSGRRVVQSNVATRIPGSMDLFRPVRGTVPMSAGLPVREAVLNSARFTYVSPAGTVPGCRAPGPDADGKCPAERQVIWDRVVDGAYFENSGVATLSDVIDALKPEAGAARGGQSAGALLKSQIYLIVIDNSAQNEPACRARKLDEDEQPALPAAVATISGVTAPLEALLHVRDARAELEVRRARADFRCGQQLIDWDLFADRGEKSRKHAEEAQHEPALGWFLSRRSARSMSDAGARVAAEFPFRLAACDDGRMPKTVRMLVGDRTYPDAVCPDLTKP